MLDLPGVTLCCIDTANHALAVRALRRSAVGNPVRAHRFSLPTARVDEPGIEVRTIAPLASRDEYSRFVLESLLDHVDTRACAAGAMGRLRAQPGGVARRLPRLRLHRRQVVLGAGRPARRQRRLFAALAPAARGPARSAHRADRGRGRDHRPRRSGRCSSASMRSASPPRAMADAFAFEAAYPIGLPFGFHGLYNFCRVVPEDELTALVVHFTPAIARSPQLAQLGRNCLALGQWRAAERDLSAHSGRRSGEPSRGGGARDRAEQHGVGSRGGPQRSLSVRQRQALQELPRRAGCERARRPAPRQRRRPASALDLARPAGDRAASAGR